MEDFENGFPPQNTDITGSQINNISYQVKEADDDINIALKGISYGVDEPNDKFPFEIKSIVYATEKAEGNNTVLFYL